MGRKGVTWEAVRLLSHGSCFQAEQRRGRSLGVAVRSERPALDFHVAPSTSGREASKQEEKKRLAMEIPAINLKVSLYLQF